MHCLFVIKGMGQKKKIAPRTEKSGEISRCAQSLYFSSCLGTSNDKNGMTDTCNGSVIDVLSSICVPHVFS